MYERKRMVGLKMKSALEQVHLQGSESVITVCLADSGLG